jgi:hypothetical protein
MSHKKYAPRRCQDGAAGEQQRAAAVAAAVAAAPAPGSDGPPPLVVETSTEVTPKVEEAGRPRWEGAAPGPARLLALEDVTSGEDTDGEVSETLQWAGRWRRSWPGRPGDGEDAVGTARGPLLLLAGAAAAAGAAGVAHAPADGGARSRQSIPAGSEHQTKRRRSTSADADADVPAPSPAPAPVRTKQLKRLGVGFAVARLGKSGRHGVTYIDDEHVKKGGGNWQGLLPLYPRVLPLNST